MIAMFLMLSCVLIHCVSAMFLMLSCVLIHCVSAMPCCDIYDILVDAR